MTLETAIYATLVFTAFLYMLPSLLTYHGFTFLRYSVVRDPNFAIPKWDSEHQSRHDELQKAGFELVGVVRERAWFIANEFTHTHYIPKYLSRDGLTYVSVCRLGNDQITLRMAAASYTTNGVAILSSMPGVGLEIQSETYVRVEVRIGSLAKLLDAHAATVAWHTCENGDSTAALDLFEIAALEQKVDAAILDAHYQATR